MNEALMGVIIGAILTGGFTWFIEWRKSVGEQKVHLREKREETYLRMLKILYLLRNEALNWGNKNISETCRREIEECYAIINVYASKVVKDKYNIVAKDIEVFFMNKKNDTKPLEDAVNLMDEFIKLIRNELEIKD